MYGGTPNDYQYQPLFGETRRRDKIINIVVALVTIVMVVVTVTLSILSGLIMHQTKCSLINQNGTFCVYPVDILFSVVILLLLIPQVFVILWYRRGELEPKFRRMIYYNAVITVLLCITANLYFFQVDIQNHCSHASPPTNSTPPTITL